MAINKKISELLRQDESDVLDFKQKISLDTEREKEEFAKDISAFANTEGGHIIYGVKDYTKELIGINPATFDEAKMQQIISMRCNPPVKFTAEVCLHEGRSIGLVTIPNSIGKPHQIIQSGLIFIRRGSTTDKAKMNEIEAMLRERIEAPKQTPADIFEKMNWGLLKVSGVRCRSILICPSDPVDSMISLSRETVEDLVRRVPGELFAAFNHFPTQNSYVIESAGRIDNIPRRRIEVFHNGLITFRRLEDIRDDFVYGQIIEREFRLICEYANDTYLNVAKYQGSVQFSLSMNEVQDKHLSLVHHNTLFLEDYETCKQEAIKITRELQLPIDIERSYTDILQEIKRCFGRL